MICWLFIWLLALPTEDFSPTIYKATMRTPSSVWSPRERGLHLTRLYVPGSGSASDSSHLSINPLDHPFFVSPLILLPAPGQDQFHQGRGGMGQMVPVTQRPESRTLMTSTVHTPLGSG